MVNPYESPPELRRLPFRQRLRRATTMAIGEFRSGLKRDGFSWRDIVTAWICLILALIVALVISAWCVAFALMRLGVI